MSTEYLDASVRYCYWIFCFVPIADAPRFFGFAEFLAALALMVLAWTMADVRYHFRIRTAPVPLQGPTFAIVAAVGVLALLTDLWRAEQWMVPQVSLLTVSRWQAILGGGFLLTFLTWAWFATIRPAPYGRRNARRYAVALYGVVLRGSPPELAVIADELARSARSIIRHATETRRRQFRGDEPPKKPSRVSAHANAILLLIADKRFCRAIVESSPGTALALFQEIADTEKYKVPVHTFATNVVNEAIAYKDSFLFHEVEGYHSGLLGHQKPLSQALFSNYRMVEAIGTLLDPDSSRGARQWDASQWDAYRRAVLLTFRDYVAREEGQHSSVLHRAMDHIEHSVMDLYKIDGSTTSWDADVLARLDAAMRFIREAIEVLDEHGVPEYVRLRDSKRHPHPIGNIYDELARMTCEVIFYAGTVTAPTDLCWSVQYVRVWSRLFNFDRQKGPAARIVKFKLRRLLHEEVVKMTTFPNFRGARILGFCLNVMGLAVAREHYYDDSRALHQALLSWTRRNFLTLHARSPEVAEACLVGSITHDIEGRRLVKTYSGRLGRERDRSYFDLNPAASVQD